MKIFKTILTLFISATLLNACQKEYSLENGGAKLPVGNWEFADSLQTYMGNIDSTYIITGTSGNELHLDGVSTDGSQNFHLILYADTFKVGSYKATLFQSSFEYTAAAKTIYEANQLVGEFIVDITSFSNDLIVGTFSGIAKDSTNTARQIMAGKFKSTFGSVTDNPVSSGVLGDSSGNCKPVVLSGIYSPGIAVTDSNTVEVEVTVAVPGTYTIATDTVNGVTFSKTGEFSSIGAQHVILTASGTPTAGGEQSFTVKYGSSQCQFTINFASPASGTLGGGGGNCTPFTFAGTFQQGLPLNETNTVQIEVTVTTPGAYNIISNTVNGVSFSKAGNFANAGVQAVTLTGKGTPVNAGPQNFAITFGAGTCNFTLSFLPGVAASNDYFPLSLNSNWTYGLTGNPADSIVCKVIDYSPAFNGKNYLTITESNAENSPANDSAYYRKPGGDYYQYVDYSGIFNFDTPVTGEFIFLKDNVPAGTTWQSPTISGNAGGNAFSGYIKMTILEKSVAATINNFTFPDIIKVKYEYFIAVAPAPAVAMFSQEKWFAKNSGQIYSSSSDGNTTTTYQVSDFHIF